jgi:hypothetical protein
MFETDDFTSVSATSETPNTIRELLREPSSEFVIECRNPLPEFGNELRSASELARHFKVTDRAIQNWYPIIKGAYYWLPEGELKAGTGKNTRYLPPAIKAMMQLKAARANGQTADDWVASIHQENAETIATWKASQSKQPTEQPIEVEIVDESSAPMIYVPDVQGLSRLDLARKKQAEVQNRLTHTLEEFKEWDETLNAEITANKEATAIEGQANFDEKVIDLLLRKKAEQDRLKKLEVLIDSGAISADELLKRYASASSSKQSEGNG